MLTVQGCRGLHCRLCLIPICLSNALSHCVWVRLISQLHFFWKIRDLCFKRRGDISPTCTANSSTWTNAVIFIFTFSLLRCYSMSPHCQWKNKYCTSSLSVALDHSESGLRLYVVEGYKCATHQRAPDYAWQSSTQEAHISPPWLKLDFRWPWPNLFPRAFMWKAYASILPPILSPALFYMHRKHKVFMTPCSRGHVQTFIRYSVMSNAPIGFPHPVRLCDWGG